VAESNFLLCTAEEFRALAETHSDRKVIIMSEAPRSFYLVLRVDGGRLEYRLAMDHSDLHGHVFRNVASCMEVALRLSDERHIFFDIPVSRPKAENLRKHR